MCKLLYSITAKCKGQPVPTYIFPLSKDGDSTNSLSNLFQCLTLAQGKSVFLCWNGISCAWICSQFLLSHYWAPVRRPWTFSLLLGIYTHWWDPLSLLFSRQNSFSSLSLASYERQSSFLYNTAALHWIHSNKSVSCKGKPRTGLVLHTKVVHEPKQTLICQTSSLHGSFPFSSSKSQGILEMVIVQFSIIFLISFLQIH